MMQAGCEPMMMGSPGSPTSPGAHGAPFLQPFLMGEVSPVGSPQAHRLWSASSTSSPPPGSLNRSFANTAANQSGAGPSVFGQTPRSENRQRDMMRPKDKAGAPPVSGLLEHIASPRPTPDKKFPLNQSYGQSQLSTSMVGTPQNIQDYRNTSIFSPTGSHITSTHKAPPSPAQLDPFYTQGESIRYDEDFDDTWITIFGFPPAATSFILQQFSQYGNVVKHAVATDGNWLHVKYQSQLQAKKALSKNGKVFGSSIMVGVSKCIDKNVMQSDKENLPSTSYLGTPTQPLNQSTTCTGSALQSPIRPLTAAYRAAASEHDVMNQSLTPRRNGNLISKAMEYMFGW